MAAIRKQYPGPLSKWERWLVAGLLLLCLGLAVAGKGRRQRAAYDAFLKNAPRVAAALEAYAADHGGRFPPDAMFVRSPAGLSPKYIDWHGSWRIDYEVHDNGHGGSFVCLEFGGPFNERRYFALCRKPWVRQKYGRGQPVPGYSNRIWLVREQAPIIAPGG